MNVLMSMGSLYLRHGVLFALLVVFFTSCKPISDSTLAPGRKAPELEVVNLNDGTVTTLSEIVRNGTIRNEIGERKRLTLVNFLASWCQPCEQEMPSLHRLSEALGESLQVISIGVEDDESALKAFRERTLPPGATEKDGFPFFHDRKGAAKQRYRLAGYPETFLLDADGSLLLVPDPEKGDAPSLKFIGPRQWDSPQMIGVLKALSPNS